MSVTLSELEGVIKYSIEPEYARNFFLIAGSEQKTGTVDVSGNQWHRALAKHPSPDVAVTAGHVEVVYLKQSP